MTFVTLTVNFLTTLLNRTGNNPLERQRRPTVRSRIADHIVTAMMVGVLVPAILTSPFGLYFLVRGGIRYYFRRNDFHREIKRLQQSGYVALTKTPQGWMIRLLKKGEHRLQTANLRTLELPRPARWDKKWRLFIFDIPEKVRVSRDLLRGKLKELGLYNIQRSVFVYPYDCREELEMVTEHYGVTKFATYAETNFIDIDRELRNHFDL